MAQCRQYQNLGGTGVVGSKNVGWRTGIVGDPVMH